MIAPARWVLPLCLLAMLGCAAQPAPAKLSTATAPAQPEWLSRALAADIVYLGEKHDNPEHHQHQAEILAALLQHGARPAVVLEMVDEDEQPTLDALANAKSAEEYRDALAWGERGWPDFAMYAPLFSVIVKHRLHVIGGNAPKAAVKRIAFGTSEPAELARFGLDTPLAPAAEKALEDELAASHCGMLPPSSLPAMALAQRARDFALARHARTAAPAGRGPRSVVIAGAGHVRRDRGAPFYAQRAEPALRQYIVGFVEGPAGAGESTAYDTVWSTSIANDVDHCKDFGKPKPR